MTEFLQIKPKQAEALQIQVVIRKYISKQYGEKYAIQYDSKIFLTANFYR